MLILAGMTFTTITLQRIDAARHMARLYAVGIQIDLLNDTAWCETVGVSALEDTSQYRASEYHEFSKIERLLWRRGCNLKNREEAPVCQTLFQSFSAGGAPISTVSISECRSIP